MPNEIPQSTALAEAQVDSLSDLFSRDPESFTKQDKAKLIEALRAQRVKWAAAEATGAKTVRQAAPAKSLISKQAVGDLGL